MKAKKMKYLEMNSAFNLEVGRCLGLCKNKQSSSDICNFTW